MSKHCIKQYLLLQKTTVCHRKLFWRTLTLFSSCTMFVYPLFHREERLEWYSALQLVQRGQFYYVLWYIEPVVECINSEVWNLIHKFLGNVIFCSLDTDNFWSMSVFSKYSNNCFQAHSILKLEVTFFQ